jgi:hypothetical protein
MTQERTLAAIAALVLTVAGFQQLLFVPPAYALASSARLA